MTTSLSYEKGTKSLFISLEGSQGLDPDSREWFQRRRPKIPSPRKVGRNDLPTLVQEVYIRHTTSLWTLHGRTLLTSCKVLRAQIRNSSVSQVPSTLVNFYWSGKIQISLPVFLPHYLPWSLRPPQSKNILYYSKNTIFCPIVKP